MERIHYIHEEFDAPALIEEYIEGREIYAAVLGNENPEVLPLVELDLSKLPEGTPKIAGKEVKWEKDTEAYKRDQVRARPRTSTRRPPSGSRDTALAGLPGPEAARLRPHRHAPDARRARSTSSRPTPTRGCRSGAEFAMAAKKAGRSYTQLIGEIVDLARMRYTQG